MAGSNEPRDEDPVVVERLLSLIAQLVYAAIDTGTTFLCFPPHLAAAGHRALEEHMVGNLRALVVVLRLVLRVVRGAEPPPFKGVDDGVDRLVSSLLALEDFRSMPEDDLRRHTAAFTEAAAALPGAIRRLGEGQGVDVEYLRAMTPDRQEFYAGILKRLPDMLMGERSGGEGAEGSR